MRGNKKFYVMSFLAVLALVVSAMLCSMKVSAAGETLSTKKIIMGVGWTEQISLYDENEKATYTYTSSDKTIAKVSKKGLITGVKNGKAKIKVTQNFNKQETIVGTITVVVKKATIEEYCNGREILGQPGYYKRENYFHRAPAVIDYDKHTQDDGTEEMYYYGINYLNPNAEYKFYSSDKSRLKIAKDGTILDANCEGEVTITVKETYNKKTRKVGTYTVNVVVPKLVEEEINVLRGEEFSLSSCMQNVRNYIALASDVELEERINVDTYEGSDENTSVSKRVEPVAREDGTWDGQLKAVEAGTAYIYIYGCNYVTNTYNDNYLGMIKVNISEMK